jgi:uncharacterized damage-inducible protein DinB
MIAAVQGLIAELDAEAPITRRVLDRLPAASFDFRPHPKSLSAGQLAQHVAAIPGNVANLVRSDGFDMATRKIEYPCSEGPAALLSTLEKSVAAAREMLESLDEERAFEHWRLTFGDRELFSMPRVSVIRTMGLNHWYHHRGELVVYLRLLDVPVPVVYGRSADENPFAQMSAASG